MGRYILTTESFINRMTEKYPSHKYDYSETVIINSREKTTIICPIHGKQYGLPHNFLKHGCSECSVAEGHNKRNVTFSTMENNLKEHFNNDKLTFIWEHDKQQNTRKTVQIYENGCFILKGCYHDLMKRKTLKSNDNVHSDKKMLVLEEKMREAGVSFFEIPVKITANSKFKYINAEGEISETTYSSQKRNGFKFATRKKKDSIIPLLEEHAIRENLTIVSDYKHYKNQNSDIELYCNKCGYTWKTTVGAFIHQMESGCANCKGKVKREPRIETFNNETFVETQFGSSVFVSKLFNGEYELINNWIKNINNVVFNNVSFFIRKNGVIDAKQKQDSDGNCWIKICFNNTLPEYIIFGEIEGNVILRGESISLKGCPQKVNGNYDCRGCGIKSFIGMPSYIKGVFDFSDNELTDEAWEYAKENIDGEFADYRLSNNYFVKYRSELY